MAGHGDDPFERYFQPRGSDATDDEGTGAAPLRRPAPPAPSLHRRGAPSAAQERLMARIAAGRKARQQRAALVAVGLVSTLALLIACAGWALTGYVNRVVARVNAGTSAAASGAPLNILVAGVDRRDGLTRRQELALHVGDAVSDNSDTMMLVHISPAHSRVTVVSLPRDSWVDIPGHGMNKINAAYGLGGPKLTVQTVEQATGLTINDYIEVGFLAFVKIIDAIGGVSVCLPVALHDLSSGIHLSAGQHHVNGITALEYARDRHSFPLQDLGRIQDQQSLLSTALTKLLSSGMLANPLRLDGLFKTVLPALRVDKGLNVSALADEMRGITSHDVVFVTVPLGNLNYVAPDGQDAVQWNQSEAARLFGEISSDQPVIKPHRQAARGKTGHGKVTARPSHRASGWAPPGARTAAQAACR
ncbi:MAG TPA: LCP family protein [Streptosporangiaceae bacterium]|jgi:LCP family protein required for cell wall assembly